MAAPFPIRIRGDAYRNQNSQRSPGLSRDHLLRSQHPAVYLLTVGPRGGSGRLFFAPSAAGNRGSRLGLHLGRRALRGFFSYHSMTAEQLFWAWCKSELLSPKRLVYRYNSYYYDAIQGGMRMKKPKQKKRSRKERRH